MKNYIKLIFSLFVAAIFTTFTACKKNDDTPKPVISNLEIGLADSHLAYLGADLHVEAEIIAEGLIRTITVEIQAEDGINSEIVAEFDYSDQTLKNTTFHKHIAIPAELSAGKYLFHLIVSDKAGNSTTVKDEIELAEINDNEAPQITLDTTPSNGENFNSGQTISISGSVTDNISLGGMLIALVYEDDSIADTDVLDENSRVIVMQHTHDFGEDPDETAFSASIIVGAEYDNNMTPALIQGDNAWKSGNYYILVKSVDILGNWAYSDHYRITITMN